jgi:anti-sigma B factor antagonist
MSLTIETQETAPGTVTLRLAGRLLLGAGSKELEETVAALLARDVRHLTFDLTAITHIDSTGMGRFIDSYAKLNPLGGSVRITGATGSVREMFRITRLDHVFGMQ